jgi:serine/threonine protein kinase
MNFNEKHVQLKQLSDHYEIICIIGHGTYGEVYKCTDHVAHQTVALKRITILKPDNGFPLTAIREIKLLQTLQHENIIFLKSIVTTESKPYVYLSFYYCEFDLHGILKSQYRSQLSTLHLISYIHQILLSLKICQDHNVLHRDLKPANIFLTRDNVIKIGDFGLARELLNEGNVRYSIQVVTLLYRPPELLMNCSNYDYAVDIWSVGCIIYEILTDKHLFNSADTSNIGQLSTIFGICGTPTNEEWPEFQKLSTNQCFREIKFKPSQLYQILHESIPSTISGIIDLLMKMLRLNPAHRISAKDAFSHEFFQ